MYIIVGKVKEINGNYFNENHKLNIDDEIKLNSLIKGINNDLSNYIIITINGNDIKLFGNDIQLIDSSLLDESFDESEVIVNPESINRLFSNENLLNNLEESNKQKENEDILDDTEGGNEDQPKSESTEAVFAKRDNHEVNIEAKLLNIDFENSTEKTKEESYFRNNNTFIEENNSILENDEIFDSNQDDTIDETNKNVVEEVVIETEIEEVTNSNSEDDSTLEETIG